MKSISIYFPAGDFADAVRRYGEGREQVYQTHNEVARLIRQLLEAKLRVTTYSFVTQRRGDEQPLEGYRAVSLGAANFSASAILRETVAADDADAIIAHFPDLELLRAAIRSKARTAVIMAGSFNRDGLRGRLQKWRLATLLNNPRFELVANHCLPATRHLAQIGVNRDKLIAWDVPHRFEPAKRPPKTFVARRPFQAIYAGSISEAKGVPEIIRAIAALRDTGLSVHCSLAGGGDVETMQRLAAELGVSDLVSFIGVIGNKDVFEKMASADLVIVPSRRSFSEGFPLTMFEAIASRTPIVCSDHPMFRDVMVDGVNAGVFPSGDDRGCAAAIRSILTDPARYAALSRRAPRTWAALTGPADWRTLIFKWCVEGGASPWIRDRMLTAAQQSPLLPDQSAARKYA